MLGRSSSDRCERLQSDSTAPNGSTSSGAPQGAARSAELLIDCKEDGTLRPRAVGMLAEMERG
jgi:hypothetical protein